MPYEHIQRGEYMVGGKVYCFRSKWEANYAVYLDWLLTNKQIKAWRYEPKFFDFMPFGKLRGVTRYLPDFEVTENNGEVVYHEVKGHLDGRSKTKLRLMAKHYKTVKLIVIDGGFMKELNRKKKLLKLY